MVSQFGSLGYTIMGKTADLTVVQKTIIDTFHKEGKPQSQVKSSLLYCQFFHMYSTYIQRIEIALLSDPWCIQLTLNTDSRRSNTDKYSLTICTYKLYRYTNEDIVEKK